MMLRLLVMLMAKSGVITFTPLSFFANGEQGAWYDPSDLTTVFQDAAGTTPVTAAEQPVGRINDKSGRGNHATQTTATKRPVLSARVNLLTKTEDFSHADWTKNATTVTANATTAPDGASTADKLIASASLAEHYILAASVTPTAGVNYTYSIYAKAGEYDKLSILYPGGSTADHPAFNLTTGTVIKSGNVAITTEIESIGNGWHKCSITYPWINNNGRRIYLGDDPVTTFLGDGTSGIYIWGASLVPADQASLPYQRVNTATDYATVGFPHYLKFDGIDDALVTGSIDFTATDKMTVVAGVRKLSDAAATILAELSPNASTNNGSFYLAAPNGAGPGGTGNYIFVSKGTTAQSQAVTGNLAAYVSPQNAVITGITLISTDVVTLRVNGVQAATSAADQGTGNFGNYPLYIGSRAGTSLPFNGHLYSLIVRGAQSTDAQITSVEAWVNSKTGAY